MNSVVPAPWGIKFHTLMEGHQGTSAKRQENVPSFSLTTQKIEHLSELAEAWLFDRPPPVSIWRAWSHFAKAAGLPTETLDSLDQQLVGSEKYEWVEQNLLHSVSFIWALGTDSVARYTEKEGKWTIHLFHAAPGVFFTQGGEFSLEGEKAAPVVVYQGIPKEDLLGAHVEAVLAAIKHHGKVEAAYFPLRSYQVPYHKHVSAQHASGVKGINAFIALLYGQETYKALQITARLYLIEALVQEGNRLFIPLLRDTALYLNKHREHPQFASIVRYLEEKDALAQKSLYAYLQEPQEVVEEWLPAQQDLVKFNHPYPVFHRVTDSSPCPSYLSPFTPTKTWRESLNRDIEPIRFLVELEEIIASLPWKGGGLEHLETFVALAKAYTTYAFRSHSRHSLQVQNRGAKLLILGYAIAASLEKKGVLRSLIPPTKGYEDLSHHPYFDWESCSAWEERQGLLKRIKRLKEGREEEELFSLSFCRRICRTYPELNEESVLYVLLQLKDKEGRIFPLPDSLKALSLFFQLAMHLSLLSDPTARTQQGLEDILDGEHFDLCYARNGLRIPHFLLQGAQIDPKEERNLMPERRFLESENFTLARMNGRAEERRVAEWSASRPELMVLTLLEWIRDHHAYPPELERYLFKVVVGKQEKIPLLDEIKRHPKLFLKRLEEALGACPEAVSLAIRLHQSGAIDLIPNLINKVPLLIQFLLCNDWSKKLSYMGELMEEKGLAWHRYLRQAVHALPNREFYLNQYLQVNETWDFSLYPLCKDSKGRVFDLMHLRYTDERKALLPESLRLHPEFIRLCGNKSQGIHLGGDTYVVEDITFSAKEFPHAVSRADSVYIPYDQVEAIFNIPRAVAHQAHWWRFKDGTIKGYGASGFTKLLFYTQGEGYLVAGERWIERIRKRESSLHPAFEYYVTYRPRRNSPVNFRDEVHFPFLRLCLKRANGKFVLDSHPHYGWQGTLFQCTLDTTRIGTPLKIQGLIFKPETGMDGLLILPLTRYQADSYDHTIHPQGVFLKAGVEKTYEPIQLEIHYDQLGAKSVREHLFAAYLSIVGKDYNGCRKFLKNIRPHHAFDEQEEEILRWIIDSQKDGHDCSSTAAALRLRAYRLLVTNRSLFTPLKAPEASLEETYLLYLRHTGEVPPLLRLSSSFERWVLEVGFHHFPPQKYSLERWKRKNEVEVVKVLPAPPLMERWAQDGDAYYPLKITEGLMQGIEHPQEALLVPGLPFPLQAFGYYFRRLKEAHVEEKRALIYKIETTILPTPLRRAFQKASSLPDLTSISWKNKKHLLKEWLRPFSFPFSAQPCSLKAKAEKPIPTAAVTKRPLFDWEESISSQELYAYYQEEIPSAAPQTPMRLSSPFQGDPPPSISKEAWESYQKEWERGLSDWNSRLFFPLPSLHKIGRFSSKEMEREFTLWDDRIHDVEMTLYHLLNRRPIEGALQEVAHHKLRIYPVDIKGLALLPSTEGRLLFLQKYNSFLLLDDLREIEKCLEVYLLFTNFKRVLLRAGEKVDQILECRLDEASLKKDPTCVQLWQEVGQLFHPFEEDENRLEAHLFEHMSGFRLRKEQAELFHQLVQKILLQEGEKRGFALVFQAMMGGGKTSVILGKLSKLAALEGKVPLFMAHHSQHASARAVLTSSQYLRHRQDVINLDFSKEELGLISVLEYLREQLHLAKKKKRLLLMKTSFLQMLQLEFLEQLKDKKRAPILAEILSFIKKRCLLIGDEVDINLHIMQGVNYSHGKEVSIRSETIDLVKTVYIYLAEEERLRLLENKQTLVSSDWIANEVFPRVIDRMLDEYPPLLELLTPPNWEEKKAALREYLLGRGEFPHLSSTATLLRELKDVLKTALVKGFNHHYGFNEEGIPIHYLGVDTPSPSHFGNIYEATCHYFQGALNQQVTRERLEFYRQHVLEAAHYYADLYHTSLSETAEAHHFLGMTGLPLNQEWGEEELSEGMRELNQSPERILDFYAELAPLLLRYHRRVLECSPAALCYMGQQFVGCAGVLWNRETYSRPIALGSEVQKGIEGKIMAAWIAKKGSIYPLSTLTPRAILDAILDKNLRALIDTAGFFDGFSNHQVAEEILDHPLLRDEIDGVVFFQTDSFFLLMRGKEKRIRLKAASKEEIEGHGVRTSNLFVYYDDLRSTGTHFELKADATAAVTFNPHSTMLRGLLQAFLRMRGFFLSQSVHTIVPKEEMTKGEILVKGLANQEEQLGVQLIRSAVEQVKEVYRSFIFYKLVETLDFPLFERYQELFYLFFEDDPLTLFNHPQEEVEGWILAEREKERWEKLFPDEEKEVLRQEVDEILAWAKKVLTKKVKASSMPAQIHVQTKKHKEVEVQKEVAREVRKFATRIDAQPAIALEWEKKVDSPTSFADYVAPPILSLQDLMKRLSYEVTDLFPVDLFLTENLSRTLSVDLPVFHPLQKRYAHFLLIKEEGSYKTLFLDYTEAAFWRKEIEKYRLCDTWLSDLDPCSLNDNHPLPEEARRIAERVAWWGHFYNGDVIKLRKHPHLVETELRREDYLVKMNYLKGKTLDRPEQAQILMMDSLFTDNPEKPPVFTFASREEEEKWKNQELSVLSSDELNRLPFHFIRFLSETQVRELKRKGYFFYLPKERFHEIAPAQVSLLPSSLLQYLQTEEQVKQVPREKIHLLKGQALQYIDEDEIERINPEELVHLKKEHQALYQRKMIAKSENFLRRVTPRMVPAILPCYVSDLPDTALPYLTTKEQLAAVDSSRYLSLAARQFHLLPEKSWSTLTLSDMRKYAAEKIIPPEAKSFVQKLSLDWAAELDPRLILFFSFAQQERVPTDRLSVELCQELNDEHHVLIQRLNDIDHLKVLSPQAKIHLTEEQLLMLINNEVELSSALIQRLSAKTLHSVSLDIRCRLIPHLTLSTLQAVLQGKEKGEMLAAVTSAQWKKLPSAFIYSYFIDKPKSLVDHVPLSRACDLSNHALLIRLDKDLVFTRLKDLLVGILSTIFYPIALLLTPFGGKKWALAPLRFFYTAAYYRRMLVSS